MNDSDILKVEITDTLLTFHLSDGRKAGAPLALYPTLLRATPAERAGFVIHPFSVHWPALDVDLDAECLLRAAPELPAYAAKSRPREPMLVAEPPAPYRAK
jgi:hypothetical protein